MLTPTTNTVAKTDANGQVVKAADGSTETLRVGFVGIGGALRTGPLNAPTPQKCSEIGRPRAAGAPPAEPSQGAGAPKIRAPSATSRPSMSRVLSRAVAPATTLTAERGRPGRGFDWRHRMRERWEQMTPEEREKFKEGMRRRCAPAEQPAGKPTA